MFRGTFDYVVIAAVVAVLTFNVLVSQANLVGDSMRPTIVDGETAFYFRVPGSWVLGNLTGQIVMVQWPDFWICHRCVADNGTHIKTQGDGLAESEPWKPKDKVRGVLVAAVQPWVSQAEIFGSAGICGLACLYFRRKENHEKIQISVNSVD